METLREFVIMKTVKKGNECKQGKGYTIDNFIEIFRVKGIVAFLSVLFFITALLLPATAYMQHTGKTVRVGWHEAPYFITYLTIKHLFRQILDLHCALNN